MPKASSSSGGARKKGRDKVRCAAYRASQHKEFNKARRLKRHLRKHPLNQPDAWAALKRLDQVLYAAHRKTLALTAFLESR